MTPKDSHSRINNKTPQKTHKNIQKKNYKTPKPPRNIQTAPPIPLSRRLVLLQVQTDGGACGAGAAEPEDDAAAVGEDDPRGWLRLGRCFGFFLFCFVFLLFFWMVFGWFWVFFGWFSVFRGVFGWCLVGFECDLVVFGWCLMFYHGFVWVFKQGWNLRVPIFSVSCLRKPKK